MGFERLERSAVKVARSVLRGGWTSNGLSLPDSCTGELSEQNDLFRLTYALETAKDMHQTYRLLSDREWSGRYAVALNAGVNGIYLLRTNLDAAFDDNGRQINPLLMRLTGNVGGVVKLFNRCSWQADSAQDASLPHQFMLVASRDADRFS